MRVLVAMLSVGFAGTERHALELANALADHCDVALLLRERPREAHRQDAYEALLHAIKPGLRVFFTSRAMPVLGLWRALARFRPDLIHAHHERSARIASRYGFGVPVLATVHMHFRARDFMRCRGLICLTQAEADAVPGDYAGVRWVIGNWVIPQPRPSAETLQSLRDSLGIGTGDYVIGTVARLEPAKGVDGLIAAFHAAALPQSRLAIVGQGSQQAELVGLARQLGLEDRVVFTGFRADARQLYSLFDLFVLNSSDEPYGLAILEAAAAGVPVIATTTVGASAIAEHLPLRLVPTGRQPALVQAMRDAWSQRPQPATPALHARSQRQQPPARDLHAWAPREPAAAPDLHAFSIERRVAEILAAYRQVAAGPIPCPAPSWPASSQNTANGTAGRTVAALDPIEHA